MGSSGRTDSRTQEEQSAVRGVGGACLHDGSGEAGAAEAVRVPGQRRTAGQQQPHLEGEEEKEKAEKEKEKAEKEKMKKDERDDCAPGRPGSTGSF